MKKNHYFLFAGQVMLANPNPEPDEAETLSVNENALVVLPTKHVPLATIGKAQNALFMNVAQKLNKQLNLIHVVITGISYLGHMTQAEFEAGRETVTADAAPAPDAAPSEELPPALQR